MSSLFSKIIAGEIPSYKVYEDDSLYAFLDIHPLHLGHTLVVPKQEIGNMLDTDDELFKKLMLTAKNIIAPAIQKATQAPRIGFIVEGMGVPDHAHLHLVPLFQAGDLDSRNAHTESSENMASIAEKIQSFL